MAKSRKPVRKAAGAKASAKKASKKTVKKPAASRKAKTARKTPARARAARKDDAASLDLKQLRKDIERAVAALASRGVADPSTARGKAQSTLSRWVEEIDGICEPAAMDICGPAMVIPLA